MTPAQLAREVDETFRQFVYLPSDHDYTVSTLWVAHTHLRDVEGRFLPYVTPRIAYLSKVAGAGKTTALTIATHLAHNGEIVIEPTQPSVVTLINDYRATLGLDEIDLYFGRGSSRSGMRTILNGGYKLGAYVTKRRNDETVRENIHAPVAMAGKSATKFLTLEAFETLRSRSHAIIMTPKPADALIDYFNEERHLPRIHTIAGQLRMWGIQNGRSVVASEPVLPTEIQNRQWEIWRPLFQVAHAWGEEWPQRVEAAARALALGEHTEQEPVQSPADELLTWVRALYSPTEEALTSAELAGRLLDLPGDHWWIREWQGASERAVSMALARQLSVHGVKHTKLRIGDATPWGYRREDIGLGPVTVPTSLEQSTP